MINQVGGTITRANRLIVSRDVQELTLPCCDGNNLHIPQGIFYTWMCYGSALNGEWCLWFEIIAFMVINQHMLNMVQNIFIVKSSWNSKHAMQAIYVVKVNAQFEYRSCLATL